jgi:uncharacterized membrane protein YuzA (DUF378 family)
MTTFDKAFVIVCAIAYGLVGIGYVCKVSGWWDGF